MAVQLDFEGLAIRLLSDARSLLEKWFPNGEFHGNEFHVGSLAGEAGASLKINWRTAKWKDFADETKGGNDLISLYAAVHQCSMGDAYVALNGARPTPLNGSNGAQAPRPVMLASLDKLDDQEWLHYSWGKPTLVTAYEVQDNDEWKVYAVVCRYEPEGQRKQTIPHIWSPHGWKTQGPPKPCQIYGQRRLKERKGLCLVVEGEKCAAVAESVWTVSPIVTWMGGVPSVMKNDWSPLYGRHVLLWPDADAPGWRAMHQLGLHLQEHECKVEVVDVVGQPEGWDVADCLVDLHQKQAVKAWMEAHRTTLASIEVLITPTIARASPKESDATEVFHQDGQQLFHVEPIGERWIRWKLQCNSRGPHPNEVNIAKCIDALQKENIVPLPWYDRFKNRLLWEGKDKELRLWSEAETQDVLTLLQGQIGIHGAKFHIVERCLRSHAHRYSRDCWQEYLHSLKWDGASRIEMLFHLGFGAPLTRYIRTVGHSFMMGIAERGLRPGCQMDYAVVLEGPQGNLKSSACRLLGEPYFAEVHADIGTVRWQEVIQGVALAEFAEMQSWSSSKNETIKAAITNRTDRYRAAYAHEVAEHPRRVVFIATTNDDAWITDPSGARRFWPVKTKHISLSWIREHKEQLYAEAVARVLSGDSSFTVPTDDATVEQRLREQSDPWEERLLRFLRHRNSTTVSDILQIVLEKPLKDTDRKDSLRIGAMLRRFGWSNNPNGGVRLWEPAKELRRWREEYPGAGRVGEIMKRE